MSLNDSLTNLANGYRNALSQSIKLSLDQMTYLSTVNNLNPIKGINLLRGTDDFNNPKYWFLGSSGPGKLQIVDLDSSFKAKHGFQIVNNQATFNRDLVQQNILIPKTVYTFSVYLKSTKPCNILIRVFDQISNDNIVNLSINNFSSSSWQRISRNIDLSKMNTNDPFEFQFGIHDANSPIFAEPMLEIGNTAHDWSPCPTDQLENSN